MSASGSEERQAATSPDRRRTFAWGTLDTYVLRRFLEVYAANLVCISTLFVLLDTVEHFGSYAREKESVGEFVRFFVRYYTAVLPLVFCQLLGPIICLTTGLFTLTALHRHNELVPMLASGRSHQRVFLPILVAGLAIAAGTFALQELYIPTTVSTIREVMGEREGKDVAENLKYLDRESGLLVVLKRYDSRARVAEGVAIFPASRRAEQQLIQAMAMEWVKPELDEAGYWRLRDGVVQNYRLRGGAPFPRLEPPAGQGERKTRPVLYEVFAERELETTLIPEDLELREDEVVYMTMSALKRKAQQSTDRRWRITYFSRLVYPLNNLVLLMLGLPVIVSLGTRNIFFGVLVAAAMAAVYFVSGSFCSDLALRGFLPAPLGAGMAPLIFSAVAVTWMRYMRT